MTLDIKHLRLPTSVAVVHVRLKDVAIAFSKPIRRPNIFDDEEDTEVPVTVFYV